VKRRALERVLAVTANGILFRAINAAQSYDLGAVERQLRRTRGALGATGPITINPRTGYRTDVPVSILRVNNRGKFVIAT
jgi:ABC-type branched-subunit amino acid transport system substrate-binding protein